MPAGELLAKLLIQISLVCQSSKMSPLGAGEHGIREGEVCCVYALSFKTRKKNQAAAHYLQVLEAISGCKQTVILHLLGCA